MSRDEIVEKLVATGYWGPLDAALGADANFECQYCGKNLLGSVDNYKEWQTDHLIPVSADGPDSKENYVISCRTCNFIKGRWNPAPRCAETEPTREQLIAVSKEYIMGKRKEAENQLAEYRKIVFNR